MTLLVVFAHPDDEAYFCAGTLAHLAAMGHDVYLLCATKGEHGERHRLPEHNQISPQKLGQIRAAELEASCQVLGIHSPIFMGYEDSGHPLEVALCNPKAFMHENPLALAKQICDYMVQYKPQIMMTFDPFGLYGHIDHIVIHRAATAAFWLADQYMINPPQRLFYPVQNTSNFSVPEASLAAKVAVQTYRTQIEQALQSHQSQIGNATDVARITQSVPDMLHTERFILGGVRGNVPHLPMQDLFADLKT